MAARELVVTVGAQCAGKTTWMRKKAKGATVVSIDDQAGVYRRVAWADAPAQARAVREAVVGDGSGGDAAALETTIRERDGPRRAEAAAMLAEAVAEVRRRYPAIGERVDELAAEAVVIDFGALKGGVEAALAAVGEAMERGDGVVGWCNTNVKVASVAGAVALADEFGYDVRVVDLTGVPVADLVLRNVVRALKTGVYVPVEAILRTHATMEAEMRDTGYVWDVPALLAACRAHTAS